MTRANRDSFGRTISVLCPDCNADTQTVEIAPNITIMQVLHDDTCPTYRAMERSRV